MSDKHFSELPKMHTTYANVIKSLLPSSNTKAKDLPSSVYTVDKLVKATFVSIVRFADLWMMGGYQRLILRCYRKLYK